MSKSNELTEHVLKTPDSSNIEQLKHYLSKDDSNVKDGTPMLEVTFKNGKRYRYYDVPMQVFVIIGESESAGKAFAKLVRPKYKFTEVLEDTMKL